MVQTHLPEYSAWQLLDVPVDRGTFLRRMGLGTQDSDGSTMPSVACGRCGGRLKAAGAVHDRPLLDSTSS